MLMRRIILLLLILLVPVLSACTGPAPTAETLLSFETRPFLCGFTVTDKGEGGTVMEAALLRDEHGDTLTVTAPHSRVVFRFENGQTYLVTEASAGEDALTLPVTLPGDSGAGYLRGLFCIPCTEGMQVMSSGEGHCISDSTGHIRFFFSRQGVLRSMETDTVTLQVTSFTFTENQDS